MAGGKLSPRQKMVNLMYLVFIAMMAMNMSKEVLSAFGLINDNLLESNAAATARNASFLSGLKEKATENDKQYGELAKKATQINTLSNELYSYIDNLKNEVYQGVKDPKDYETQDKSKFDEVFFAGGDKYSPKGQEFVDKLNNYRTEVIKLLGNDYKEIQADINKKFSTNKEKTRDGIEKQWLDYHFKGFPLVASITKLTKIQADIKSVESEILSNMLQGNLASQVSMSNYKAIVVLDKNAFYQGEQVTGKIVLGRYDENTQPTEVKLNTGSAKIENGQAMLNISAGAVGEHDIKGKFVFMENGEAVDIDIEGKYVVVPKPNNATISADKMNSIYRGVENPMTISFAGVSANNVTVSAPGLTGSNGKYVWRPDGIQGEEATVTVTGKLPDGQTVSDKKTFKVRNIPAPTPSIRSSVGSAKGNKNDLANSTVKAAFPDFVFDVNAEVKRVVVLVPGNAPVIVEGDKFNDAAKKNIAKAQKGDVIVIKILETKLVGAGNYKVKESTAFTWEVQ